MLVLYQVQEERNLIMVEHYSKSSNKNHTVIPERTGTNSKKVRLVPSVEINILVY